MVAMSFSPSGRKAKASPAHTVKFFPARLTWARATIASPVAGARRLTLNSTVSTSEPSGASVSAAYPQAESRAVVTAPACTTALDSACGYAALTLAPEGSEVLTVEFKVNLLAPATGEAIVARAQVKRAGKNLTVCAGDAFALRPEGEKLIATMLATMIYVPLER